jgi:hypothetical protein
MQSQELWDLQGLHGNMGWKEGQGPAVHTHQSGMSVEPIMEAILITGLRATQAR